MPTSSLQPAGLACAAQFRATLPNTARRNPLMRDIIGSPAFIGALLVAATLPLSMGSASAASFTVSANDTVAKTLGPASGEIGTVNAGKTLTVKSSTVAVTISGNGATLNNLGTISQTGTGRAVRDNTGVTGLTINNGSVSNSNALMQTADADVIQMNLANSSVILNNWGSLISKNASAGGSQAVDFSAMSGANVVNNFAGGVMLATEADAVRPGLNGSVFNAGSIKSVTSSGSSSDGIDAQANSGIQLTNYATGLVEGGRHGITGGQASATSAFAMNVSNSGTIQGDNGSGLNLDGFNARQLVTVVNSGKIIGNGVSGDGDGVDVDGLVNLTNTTTGIIRSVNAFSAAGSGLAFSEGITVGGGTITNAGLIEGLVAAGNTNAVGRGITLAGNDISAGPLSGTREGLYGNATITNQAGGMIRGQSDSAIVAQGAASGFTVTINNNAGATILGGGSSNAAILGGADKTIITNAGIINGASSGKAIELGSAQNTLIISGGSAAIIGSINGGSGATNSMIFDLGAGNRFFYSGAISNFHSVELKSGNVTLDGANRIAAASELILSGGKLLLVNAGASNGQTFASLSLSDSSAIDLGSSSISFSGLGAVAAGKTLTVTDSTAGSAYAFRFMGNYSTNANFLTLIGETSIDGLAARYKFDGVYTDVTAVPEPETHAMLLAGLGLMGLIGRRRKQAAMA